MEEEDGEDLTPFWIQNTTNHRRSTDRIRNGLSSLFFSSGLLIILLLVTAVSFLIFVVPSTLSFSTTAPIFIKPTSVKKSWDSLNIVLVLFALVFGFLSRITNQDRNSNEEYQINSPISRNYTQKSSPSAPQSKWYNYSSTDEDRKPNFHQQWFGYSDQISRGGLRRTSSSYPDLLEASSSSSSQYNDPWRFYDDMTVDTYRPVTETGHLLRRRSWKDKFEVPRMAEFESKNIDYVDKIVERTKEASINGNTTTPKPPSPSPSPPPPSPPPMPKEKPKRVHRSIGHKSERRNYKRKNNELENKESISLPVRVTTPPPPPPPPPQHFLDQKSGNSEKKRNGGNATKDFIHSLYHKKKKKQRQKSIENFDALLHQSQPPPLQFQIPPAAPPPPPPPPPPSSASFHNLFTSKKSRRKRSEQEISASSSKSKPSTSQIIKVTTLNKSPKPVKIKSFDSVEENSNSRGDSPLIPIPPPPPPPPPFAKSLSWKFVVQGDYVRVDSISSRSGSPEIDDVESDNGTPTTTDGGDFPPSPLFFPSPDVNTKAENFISNFRAGLKLEKIDSMNKKQGLGLSNLGRASDSSQL
ncbi:hypothetical protein M9H77_15278 [Catharanthus roseus]|uniref:Uncharacterized protein n=1 Tax=Catharanthus roseus TaxID=4058 RepID=A0ACC0AX36_CATRO|nr:hypothetical protein M9H77_15278 [Catharanthus roseus]